MDYNVLTELAVTHLHTTLYYVQVLHLGGRFIEGVMSLSI